MLSNSFYFKLRAFSRLIKSVFNSISILTFKTNSKSLILALCLKTLLVIFLTIVCLTILSNLPVYLLQILPTNTVAISFTSHYLHIYEFIVLNLNLQTLLGPINRCTTYFYLFFFLFIWKLFNVTLFLQYELDLFKNKNLNQTFEEFKNINSLNSYSCKTVSYRFNKESKIYKNIYLFFKFLFLLSSNIRLFFNYFLVVSKKVKLHLVKYVMFNSTNFSKSYFNSIVPNKIVLWRPIFKRLSYFGLFRAYRSKWIGRN